MADLAHRVELYRCSKVIDKLSKKIWGFGGKFEEILILMVKLVKLQKIK